MSLFPKSVRVPIDTIRTSSGKLAELVDQVQDYFDQLGNLADGLSSDGTWQGNDATAFIKANASNQKSLIRQYKVSQRWRKSLTFTAPLWKIQIKNGPTKSVLLGERKWLIFQ